MRVLTSLLLISLPLLALKAQDDLGEETPAIRRYTVEMIIFRYAEEVSPGSEIFLADEPALDAPIIDEAPVLIDGELLEEIPPVPRLYRDIAFTPLPEEQYTLGEIWDRLENLDVYEPLMHFAWTQATWPDDDTLPIELGEMGAPPPGLDGSLRLYLSRYLHLVVDVSLDASIERTAPDEEGDTIVSFGDYRAPNLSAMPSGLYDVAMPAPLRYRIEENRILRSGELRYFDHPKFGVLAKVTRAEDQPAEVPENAESELLGYPAE